MTILVQLDKKAGQRQGDWIVRNGAGGPIVSRHRLKRKAVEKGRDEARKRGTDIRIQNTNGQWKR